MSNGSDFGYAHLFAGDAPDPRSRQRQRVCQSYTGWVR